MLLDLDGTLLRGDSSVWVTAALVAAAEAKGDLAKEQGPRDRLLSPPQASSLRRGLQDLVNGGLVDGRDLVSFGFNPAEREASPPADPDAVWVKWYADTKEVFAELQRDPTTSSAFDHAVREIVRGETFQAQVFAPMRAAVQILGRRSQLVMVSGALEPVPVQTLGALLTPTRPLAELLDDAWRAVLRPFVGNAGSPMAIGASTERQNEPFGDGKARRVENALARAKRSGTRVAALVVDSATGDGKAILKAIAPPSHDVGCCQQLRVPVIMIVNANEGMKDFLAQHKSAVETWQGAGGELFQITIPPQGPPAS